VTQYIVPAIGNLRLQDVNREVLARLYRSLPQAAGRNSHIALRCASASVGAEIHFCFRRDPSR
jgi:hypothetical protein